MIRVFILYYHVETLKKIQETVVHYFRDVRHTFELTACYTYQNAVAYLKKSSGQDDIYLLDFSEFEKANRLVTWLRGRNLNASWVNLGGSKEKFLQTLILRPSGYIEHPENRDEVFETIRKLDRYHQAIQKKYYFSFKYEGEQMRIPYDEISYFESSAKKVTLYRANSDQKYYFTAKLDDIGQRLPSFFLRCHQSYLVNMHMIRCLDTKAHVFMLHTNEEIWISRRMYAQAKERYQNFMDESEN